MLNFIDILRRSGTDSFIQSPDSFWNRGYYMYGEHHYCKLKLNT